MNASQRPQRRRKSALADEHPAYPAPAPASESEYVSEPDVGDESEPSRAATRARGHTGEVGISSPSRQAEQRARADARNGAWAWAKAAVRSERRMAAWCDEMRRARDVGTAPAVLREYIGEAAERVGIEPGEVPVEVWQAAGLEQS